MSLNQTANAIRHQIEQYATNITEGLEGLPDDALWAPGPGGSNSIGTLVHHLSGNLRHFFGTGLLENDFRRDRPAEFADRDLSRQKLLDELEEAVQVTRNALETLDARAIDVPHTSPDGHEWPSLAHMLLQMSVHFGYHTGQINYAARMLRKA